MKGISKVMLGLGAAAVMVLASMPVAEAQCTVSRNLGAGNGNNTVSRIKILPPGGEGDLAWNLQDGNSVGSIWQVGKPTANSGGEHFGGGGACPAEGHWLVTGTMFPGADVGGTFGNTAISADIASPACLLSLCPDDGATMITVVEDESNDGSTAGFIVFTVDETPAAARTYDHARVIGSPVGINSLTMRPFPSIDVAGSVGPPPNTSLNNNYADLAVNVFAVDGPGNTAQPASGSVLSYDIMSATSMTDPGRNRSAYSLVKSVPYSDAAVVGDNVNVPCSDTVSNTFLAVGVTYADGIESVKVGPAVAVECDPAHADPDGNNELQDDRSNRLRPRSRSANRGR
jgi:hypothetical protein